VRNDEGKTWEDGVHGQFGTNEVCKRFEEQEPEKGKENCLCK